MDNKNLFTQRQILLGNWIAIMSHKRNDRSLKLALLRTRCIQKGEIHEFMTCSFNQSTLVINEVAYLGFGEMTSSGVIAVGDLFYQENELIGEIIGFNDDHYPNHYNIVIANKNLLTGADRGLRLNSGFFIKNNTYCK